MLERKEHTIDLNSFLYFQLSLIRAGWNELLIAAFSFKSTHLNEDGIRLSDGTVIAKDEAHMAGKIDNSHFYIFCMIVIVLIDWLLIIMKENRLVTSNYHFYRCRRNFWSSSGGNHSEDEGYENGKYVCFDP